MQSKQPKSGIHIWYYCYYLILLFILQNQKVCWLLTYHDSFISTLQIYAQKKEYKRYHSNFYHIDSTLTPHRLSTGLASQITILLALIPLIISEVRGSNQCDKNWRDIFYILVFERIDERLSRDHLTTNILFGFRKYRSFWAWKHKPKIF